MMSGSAASEICFDGSIRHYFPGYRTIAEMNTSILLQILLHYMEKKGASAPFFSLSKNPSIREKKVKE